MAVAVKVGPWGASIGQQHHDIPIGSNPQARVSITICSSNLPGGKRHILGLAFVYADQNGDPIPVGPWGVIDPEQKITPINMGPGEYLYKLSGIASAEYLFGLKLVTNQNEYTVGAAPGPTPTFSVPLVNGKVVAFFGRSDNKYLKALGIYVAPVQDWPVKMGPPWGGSRGIPVDIPRFTIASRPQALVSITICSSTLPGGHILGFAFVYVDQNGVHDQSWGMIDPEQRINNIEMGPGEYVNDMSGTFNDLALYSLRLVTNKMNVYTAGNPEVPLTKSFSVPLRNGKVVAFFGRSHDDYLTALGIYMAPVQDWPVKIGPWGGSGGVPVDITTPVQLKSVTVYSDNSSDGRIYGFSFTYIDENGDLIVVGPWGQINGQGNTFELDQGEYVNNICGTFDHVGVTSLKFTTNQVVYGPFGCERGTAFSVPLRNGAVVGFFGRSGESLVALGVYVSHESITSISS